MAKHTPGPWTIHVEEGTGMLRTQSWFICADKEWPEGQLARVNVQDGLGEQAANASLIAAAPDFYEFVERVSTITNIGENCDDDTRLLTALKDIAGRLLAKAESPNA